MGGRVTDYKNFSKALKGSFEAFVRSDVVNAYLQTIGSAVTTKVLQDGISHEFTIVSGYEEERGNWATAYNSRIRFGSEIHPVEGLTRAMVLTPNFFYGQNQQGGEVEYRMGLVKGNTQVNVLPVILRKTSGNFQARILEDLCVIHTGISIDPQTGKVIGKEKALEITTYYQFLAVFWNIDDYLRKQNPAYHSDFEIGIWEAVEAFSSRIVDQMLGKIASVFKDKPEWQMNQLAEGTLLELKNLIIQASRNSNLVKEGLLIRHLNKLCSLMNRYQNFTPFEELLQQGIEIFPYIIEVVQNYPHIIDQFPKIAELIGRSLISKIEAAIKNPSSGKIRVSVSKLCFYTVRYKIYTLFDEFIQKDINIILYILENSWDVDSGVRGYADEVYEKILGRFPHLVEQVRRVLILNIEDTINNPSKERKLLSSVQKLCFYMSGYQNYTPLNELYRKGINILPALIKSYRKSSFRSTIIHYVEMVMQQYPELVDSVGRALVLEIEEVIRAASDKHQLLTKVMDLCFFVHYCKNYDPLDELIRKNPSILLYILETLEDSYDDVRRDAEHTYRAALQRFPELPELLWRSLVSKIEEGVKNKIEEHQILDYVKELCSVIFHFGIYTPLEELMQKDINVLLFIAETVEKFHLWSKTKYIYKEALKRFPKLAETEWRLLVLEMEPVLKSPKDLHQVLAYVKKLCSFIQRSQNYAPLEELIQKDINILPYLTELSMDMNKTADIIYHEALRRFPKLAETVWRPIVSQIEKAVKNPIEEIHLLVLVLKLCSFMVEYRNYMPCEELLRKNININLYLRTFLEGADKDLESKIMVLNYFKMIIENNPSLMTQSDFEFSLKRLIKLNRRQDLPNLELLLEKKPEYLTEYIFKHIMNLFHERNIFHDLLKVIINKKPDVVESNDLNKFLYEILNVNNEVDGYATSMFIFFLRNNPQLIIKVDIGQFIKILKKLKGAQSPHKRVKARLRNILQASFERAPTSTIIQLSIPTVLSLLKLNFIKHNPRPVIIQAYIKALKEYPPVINASFLDELQGYLKTVTRNREMILKKVLIQFIRVIFESGLKFTEDGIEKLYSYLSGRNPDLHEFALQAYKAALNPASEVIDEDFKYILRTGIKYIEPIFLNQGRLQSTAILEILEVILQTEPRLVTQSIINRILDFVTDSDSAIKTLAGKLFHLAIQTTPELIPETLPILLRKMLKSQDPSLLKELTVKAYENVKRKAPQAISQATKQLYEYIFSQKFTSG